MSCKSNKISHSTLLSILLIEKWSYNWQTCRLWVTVYNGTIVKTLTQSQLRHTVWLDRLDNFIRRKKWNMSNVKRKKKEEERMSILNSVWHNIRNWYMFTLIILFSSFSCLFWHFLICAVFNIICFIIMWRYFD